MDSLVLAEVSTTSLQSASNAEPKKQTSTQPIGCCWNKRDPQQQQLLKKLKKPNSIPKQRRIGQVAFYLKPFQTQRW